MELLYMKKDRLVTGLTKKEKKMQQKLDLREKNVCSEQHFTPTKNYLTNNVRASVTNSMSGRHSPDMRTISALEGSHTLKDQLKHGHCPEGEGGGVSRACPNLMEYFIIIHVNDQIDPKRGVLTNHAVPTEQLSPPFVLLKFTKHIGVGI